MKQFLSNLKTSLRGSPGRPRQSSTEDPHVGRQGDLLRMTGWYFCQQKTRLSTSFLNNSGSEFPSVTEQASFISEALGRAPSDSSRSMILTLASTFIGDGLSTSIISPTDSSATPLSSYQSNIESANLSSISYMLPDLEQSPFEKTTTSFWNPDIIGMIESNERSYRSKTPSRMTDKSMKINFKNLKMSLRTRPWRVWQSSNPGRFLVSLGMTMVFLFILYTLYFILSPSPALAANSNNFTLSLWVKPASSVASKTLIGKAEEMRVFTNASGLVGCQIKATTWQTAAQATSKALTLNTWAHVVCTYDQVNLTVFVNGTKVATTALTAAVDDTAAALKLGQDDSASTPYTNLAGTIDEYKFYSYALTSDEVKTEFNQGKSLSLGGRSVNDSTPASLANGLVGYWKMDESSGNAVDSSGNNNTLTNNNTTTYVAGQYANSANFVAASSQSLSILDASQTGLEGMSKWTFSVWVNPTTLSGGNGYYPLITKSSTNGNVSYEFDIVVAGRVAVTASNSGGYVYCNNIQSGMSVVSLSTWTHLVATYDGSKMRIYKNGSELISGSFPYSDTRCAVANTSSPFGIGGGQQNGLNNYFDGKIDEARVYNRALSPAEVAQLYQWAPGTVGQWKMDEKTGISAKDTSGNGYDGTLTGPTHLPTWSEGKNGGAVKLDGTDDYINLGTLGSFGSQRGSGFTNEFWVKLNTSTAIVSLLGMDEDGNGKNGFNIKLNAKSDNTLLAGSIRVALGSNDATPIFLKGGTDTNTIPVGIWKHLAVTLQPSTNTITVYVNGVAQAITYASQQTPATFANFALNMALGANNSGGNLFQYFNGSIDEVKIYNYARTPAQIAWDYNKGKPVGWWKFDECTGGSVFDSSGNKNNATIYPQAAGQLTVGDCTTNANTMWYNGRTGKRNHSLNFDGSDDYVYNSAFSWSSAGGPVTISFWNYATGGGSAFDIGSSGVTRFQAHVPYGDNVLYWDYGNYQGNGRISTNYVNYLNRWTHVTLVSEGNNGTFKGIYLDGKLVASSNVSDGPDVTLTGINIGRAVLNVTLYHTGKIDDFKIFNYALSADQVKTEYNGGVINFGPSTGTP